jgi:hypothetical protein
MRIERLLKNVLFQEENKEKLASVDALQNRINELQGLNSELISQA